MQHFPEDPRVDALGVCGGGGGGLVSLEREDLGVWEVLEFQVLVSWSVLAPEVDD